MEYCCHVWAGASSCYSELLRKLQKRICRTVGSSLADSLEPLAHRLNVANLSLFCRCYFGKCLSELVQLVRLPYSQGWSPRYSDRLHDVSVNISKCYKDLYVNSFFPRTARLWNSLPRECFPLNYDLNGFKSRINRHLLTLDSFWTYFLYALIFLRFFFLYLHALQWLLSLAWSEPQLKKNIYGFPIFMETININHAKSWWISSMIILKQSVQRFPSFHARLI